MHNHPNERTTSSHPLPVIRIVIRVSDDEEEQGLDVFGQDKVGVGDGANQV